MQPKNRRVLVIGIALFLAIAVGTLTILTLREDRGFTAAWPPASVPIPVILSPEAADYIDSARSGVTLWNGAAGCPLLRDPIVTELPEGSRGAITFRVDNKLGDDPGDRDSWPHGVIIERGGLISAVPLILPSFAVFTDRARADRVMAHELGHGLGHDPDHDDQEESVMYRRASATSGATGSYRVTEKDSARLAYLCALRR